MQMLFNTGAQFDQEKETFLWPDWLEVKEHRYK